LSSRVVNRFEQTLVDMLVVETWLGGGTKTSVPASFARKLLNYWLNEPAVDTYITWEPRDISDRKYSVELVSVLPGSDARSIQLVEILERGGKYDGGEVLNALDEIDGPTLRTGMLAVQLALTMKIVADVTT